MWQWFSVSALFKLALSLKSGFLLISALFLECVLIHAVKRCLFIYSGTTAAECVKLSLFFIIPKFHNFENEELFFSVYFLSRKNYWFLNFIGTSLCVLGHVLIKTSKSCLHNFIFLIPILAQTKFAGIHYVNKMMRVLQYRGAKWHSFKK